VVSSVSIVQHLLDAGLVGELHVDICRYFEASVVGRLKAPALRASGSRKSARRVGARTSLRFGMKQ
jgi:hypothetical protein